MYEELSPQLKQLSIEFYMKVFCRTTRGEGRTEGGKVECPSQECLTQSRLAAVRGQTGPELVPGRRERCHPCDVPRPLLGQFPVDGVLPIQRSRSGQIFCTCF
jgi:hypothetical protein